MKQILIDRLGARLGGNPSIDSTPLQFNYFSVVFRADVRDRAESFFIKVPKADLRKRGRHMLPLSAEDRALGLAEYASLTHLQQCWDGRAERVSFVEPFDYVDDFNAVVTRSVPGEEATIPFRRQELWSRLGAPRSIDDAMERIGSVLARHHHATSRSFEGAIDVRDKIVSYVRRLTDAGIGARVCRVIEKAAGTFSATPARSVTTLKGIDIRNVLVDPDGALHLLDPGKSKQTAPEADLARFLVTWRILYQGSPWFLLRVQPRPQAEAAFLAGYGEKRDPTLLRLMLIKELLKHWHTAHGSLSMRPWPLAARHTVGRLYIDGFYERELLASVRTLH